jgi:hypothetical protein
MSIVASISRTALKEKPRHGEPCNNCGACCQSTLCPLGSWVFHRDAYDRPHRGPCPALELSGEGYACGLITNPIAYDMKVVLLYGHEAASEAAAHLNGAGQGCDARFNGEPPNLEFYDRLLREDARRSRKTAKSKKIWGIR